VAAGLVLAKIALQRTPESPHPYMTSDPILHHRSRPNAKGRVRGVDLITNSLGLHDREVTRAKPPGVIRILMLGDSFTEGRGLPLEATVAKRAEDMLNGDRCPRVCQVLNGGVSSYSPLLEFLFLQRVGLGLEPDLVVMNFDMTDVHDDLVRTAIARLDAQGLPESVPTDRRREAALLIPPFPKPWFLRFLDPVERLVHRSKLYQVLRASPRGQRILGSLTLSPERMDALGIVGNLQYDIEAITRDGNFPGHAEAWRLSERYIVATHTLARAHGLPFVLVVYPHAQQVAADASLGGRRRHGLGPGLYASERPFQILEALGRRVGFPVVNLLHLFREHTGRGTPLFWPDDIHHTPAGANLFASGIVAGLQQHQLVTCPSPAP
jgi:hypothetical protein